MGRRPASAAGCCKPLGSRASHAGWSEPPVWVHGDCHLDNILLDEQNTLSGIVDWGDMHKGDPALDLFVVFFLHPTEEETFWSAYGRVDQNCYHRAKHRAMLYTLILLEYGIQENLLHFISMGRHLYTRMLPFLD